MRFLALSAILLVATAPLGAEGLDIVERAVAFHGGDLFERTTTELSVCSRSGCFDLRVRRQGGLFEYDVRGEVRGQKRRVVSSNDQVEAWVDGEREVLDARGSGRARDFANARVYFVFLPYGLLDASTRLQDLGVETWRGRPLRKVKVTFEAGSSTDADDEYLYWFDPETGRLEQFAYSFREGEGLGLRFRRLVDYRRVGGLLFFDQENLGSGPSRKGVDSITPESVAAMEKISTVRLRDIRVTPLP